MSLREFGLLIISVLTAITGQVLLKAGALKLGRADLNNALSLVVRFAQTPELVFGLMLYGLSAILYILLLTRVKLSVAAPAAAIGYVFSVMMGYFIFRESIPPSRFVGLGLIACGVILVAWKN